ncbi:hypothetical protein CEXT_62671 [Caerostris extrusa]|uniref:Uncharacterized protein n=1 Tax=Caerostris extrusa TaxID=172846 RepID=A0AAV4VWD1_CAEEX|nr:hypothetical protein CEXT_62671 [Caerostris extrusa]
MSYSDNETSSASASEDIGSEDTPEEFSEDELDFSSPTISTTTSSASSPATSPATSRATSPAASPAASLTASPAASPRRSSQLEQKRSLILEKDGVNFRTKRRRVDLPPPQMMVDPVPGLKLRQGSYTVPRSICNKLRLFRFS